MTNGSRYTDPILARIRDLLNEHGPKELKNNYWLGDPLTVNKSQLPACFISFERQDLLDSSAFELETQATVLINVAYDLTRDFGGQNKKSASHMALTRLLCGRNDKFELLDDSILGVLRRFEDASPENGGRIHFDLGTNSQIEYVYAERGDGVFTNEVLLRFVVKTHQML